MQVLITLWRGLFLVKLFCTFNLLLNITMECTVRPGNLARIQKLLTPGFYTKESLQLHFGQRSLSFPFLDIQFCRN